MWYVFKIERHKSIEWNGWKSHYHTNNFLKGDMEWLY